MSKGNGLWKFLLAGTVVSLSVAGGLYLSVPKSPTLSVDTVKAAEGDFARSLYGMPDLGMGHYKLNEDQYFKYQVDGTLDVSRDNPSKVTTWMLDNEKWESLEMYDDERLAFDEKRLKVLQALGDTDNASKIEKSLQEKEEAQAALDAEKEAADKASVGADESVDGEVVDVGKSDEVSETEETGAVVSESTEEDAEGTK